MANGTFTPHNKAADALGREGIHLATDTYRMMLVNGWTPDLDNDDFWSDVSANEVSLTNYTAGGQTLSSVTFTRDDANNRSVWDFADVTWSNLQAGSVSHAVVVRWSGSAATSEIIGNIELVTQPNGGNYTVGPPAGGAMYVQGSAA